MWKFTDPARVVDGTAAAHNIFRVLGVGAPERHLGDAVCLGDDALGEAERLERFNAAGLNAVRLADLQALTPVLDDAGHNARELRELGRRQHACRTGANNEHVHLIRKVLGTVDSAAGCRLDTRVAGYVSVVVKLHRDLLIALGRLIHHRLLKIHYLNIAFQ